MLTVGEILKRERLNKGLTLDYIEKQVRIRAKYLKAIEENNWSLFSSRIYIEGIIKNYARYLKIDQKKIQAFFRRDYEKKEDVKFNKKVSQDYLTPETRKFLKLALTIVIVLFVSYFVYQLKIYFSPLGLEITSPKNTNFTVEKKINIVAKTDKDTMVVIAGDRVFQDKNGIFKYELPLNEGENKLVIELTGANGRKTEVVKTFIKRTPK